MMDWNEALRIALSQRPGDTHMGDVARALADQVRSTVDRDEWKEKAENRQALLDSHGLTVRALRRERDRVAADLKDAAEAHNGLLTLLRTTREERDTAREKLAAWMDTISRTLSVDPAVEDIAAILGELAQDARMWNRVKELAAGNFRAGDVVTADAVNALSEAVATGKPKVSNLMDPATMAAFEAPARQYFPVGAPEPPEWVRAVECHILSTPLRFVRVAETVSGDSLWRLSDRPSSTELWMWKDITEEPSREVLPQ
jgi:hypothetical protein